MIFNSIDFAIFFPIVFFTYWILFKKNVVARNLFLIGTSYLFYGWWDWRFLLLIILSSVVDFLVGKKIHQHENQKVRKRWLLVSLTINLGLLGFFKYFNFFIDSFVDSFSFFGATFDGFSLKIILPVGISFYTFQTLSYTLDIYYKRLKPTKDIFAFFAFVSFFPQLVAGPIERAKKLLPQFSSIQSVNYNAIRSGLLLMMWGFFKKIVISDRLAIFVNNVYGDAHNADGITAAVAMLFFAFQLYLDFSAYSDIAIGAARTLGFDLSTNFKRPYLAKSFSDFWKRWHISLSEWFRDYVYIPLGGNQVSKFKVTRNILIVFLLSGLWHGASWNFVIWGGINAVFILLFDRFLSNKNNKILPRILISVFVFSTWSLSLVFFRAESFGEAISMYGNLVTPSKQLLYEHGLNSLEFSFTIKLLGLYVVFELFLEKFKNLYSWFVGRHFIIRWFVYLLTVAFILLFGSYGVGLNDNNFIYFQF
ncbi:MAG: alginate O-acetyltransferase complex protein AlgI [Glaciecola sp.]|jgi:alginate O-acetyltransferase complex protein AlgI